MGNSLQQWRSAIGTLSQPTSCTSPTFKFTRCWTTNHPSGTLTNMSTTKSKSLSGSRTTEHKHQEEVDNFDHEPPTEKSVWKRGWIKRLTMREIWLKMAPTLLVILLIALMIGGVEVNPGPRPGNSSETDACQDYLQIDENAAQVNKPHSAEATQGMYEIGRELCRKDWKTRDMDETELSKQIDLFRQLAVEYKKLFEEPQHIEGWYFVRSAGLLNAALNCIKRLKTLQGDSLIGIENDCTEMLQELETTFLKRVNKHIEIPTKKLTQKYQEELKQLRQFSDCTINSIVKDDMKIDLETVEMTVADERRTIQNSKAFYNELTNKLVSFYGLLIDDCLNVLGTPNCSFCFVGLGSLARQEATAYSDLESAIIFDDTGKSDEEIDQLKVEFRLIVHYLHFKILNLGETVIPSLSIPVLNDFNKELTGEFKENKFFDSISPQGLCFDGAMPWASKTPIGRSTTENKPARELIMTPDEMSECQKEDVCLKEGYHLSDVLMTTRLVYGDGDVHDRYKSKLRDILKSDSKQCPGITIGGVRATETLKEDLDKYVRNPLSPETLSKQVHVKKDIYRFATMSVNSLKLKYGCVAQSPLNVLEELYDRSLLTERAKIDLQVMVCSCINLRHLTYNKYKRQKEFISFVSRPPEAEQERPIDSRESLSVRDFSAIYRFFLTFLPWVNFLKAAIESKIKNWKYLPRYIESSERIKGMLHKEMNFFENALLAFKKEETQIMNSVHETNKEQLVEIQASIGSLYKTNSMYEDALKYYNKALDLEMAIHNDQYHAHIASLLDNIGEIYWSLAEYKNAQKYHKLALKMFKILCKSDTFDNNVAKSLMHLGWVHMWLSEYTVALSYLTESRDIFERINGNNPDRDFAKLFEGLGLVSSYKSDFTQALSYHYESCSMRKKIWIDVPHADIAMSLSNIAVVYSKQGDLTNALSYHTNALAMWRQVYGDKPHASIATSMSNIGAVYSHKGDLTNALSYHSEALMMRREVYGDKPHASIANSMNNIGRVHYKQGDLINALSYHTEALMMKRQVYGDKPHASIAISMNNIGGVYCKLGDLTNALSYHIDALTMKSHVYGDKPHASIATSMNSIGDVYYQLSDLTNALSYHIGALTMRRQVHGDKPHADIANSLNQIAAVYSQQGDLTKALSYHNDALAMWRQVYGDKPHADIATSLYNIGSVYYEQGDTNTSLQYYTDALTLFRQVYNDKPNDNITLTLDNIANAYREQGDMTNYKKYSNKSEDMKKKLKQ
ncbi:unnamed protein product [Owenia fusiformis]|uniref:Protein-PII uridylyltransferase N-terminal domain-containing protein n=1 Tax=Owenia fusiformis TaxID=6347 RepID=A0A8J1Y0U5_OWEFU|nr:unnamed protein product [Owenia fusiformis]